MRHTIWNEPVPVPDPEFRFSVSTKQSFSGSVSGPNDIGCWRLFRLSPEFAEGSRSDFRIS